MSEKREPAVDILSMEDLPLVRTYPSEITWDEFRPYLSDRPLGVPIQRPPAKPEETKGTEPPAQA